MLVGMVTYSATTVPLESLLLDPNNFRFRQPGVQISVPEGRFVEESVQLAILAKLRNDGISEVKRSIAENGFVPVERIVVKELRRKKGTEGSKIDENPTYPTSYIVIEGNRRTAALKLLQQEHASGAQLKETVQDVFDAVPVLLASNADADDLLAIMGIRHVGGPKEWGGYQSALLVYELMEESDLDSRQVASRLGLSVQEVNRRHRAFSVLVQMSNDHEYGELVTPEMYPIFHEIVGQPKVREWFGWDGDAYELTNATNREQLYIWMTDDTHGDLKIDSYGDIRDLKIIIDNPDALAALWEEDQSLADALAIVKSEAKATKWLPNVKAAFVSLRDMSLDTIENLDEESLAVLRALKNKTGSVLRAAEASQMSDPEAE